MIGPCIVATGGSAVEFRAALAWVGRSPRSSRDYRTGRQRRAVPQRTSSRAVKRVDSGDGVAILTDMSENPRTSPFR